MQRNLKKNPNRVFIKNVCSICLEPFDAEEYVYQTTYDRSLVCYDCARQTEERILKRLDEKIDYLKRQKEILLK